MNITISMPEKLVEKLRKHAKENARSISGIVRISLEKYIDDERKSKIDDSCN